MMNNGTAWCGNVVTWHAAAVFEKETKGLWQAGARLT